SSASLRTSRSPLRTRRSASSPASPRGRPWSRSTRSRCAQGSGSVAEDEAQAGASQEELIEQLEAELKKLKISDVLVQTIFTVSSLGFAKLREDDRDLEQVKLAIESMRALVPSLEGAVPAEVIRDFNQMVANLQLAYAKAVTDAGS